MLNYYLKYESQEASRRRRTIYSNLNYERVDNCY